MGADARDLLRPIRPGAAGPDGLPVDDLPRDSSRAMLLRRLRERRRTATSRSSGGCSIPRPGRAWSDVPR